MLAVGFRLDVYSLKFEHKLGYWPVCQLTFIDVWSRGHGDTRLPRRQNPIIRKCWRYLVLLYKLLGFRFITTGRCKLCRMTLFLRMVFKTGFLLGCEGTNVSFLTDVRTGILFSLQKSSSVKVKFPSSCKIFSDCEIFFKCTVECSLEHPAKQSVQHSSLKD